MQFPTKKKNQNQNKPTNQKHHFRDLLAFIFFPAVAFTLDIQPTQQVLIRHSIKSFSCQSPAVSVAQCFQNLHTASIHRTLSVGLSYHWVALQLYMKGHKVNENSIKTLLAFSEITKPCSELNISFSFSFFFNSQYPEPATAFLFFGPFWGVDVILEAIKGFDFEEDYLRV